MASRRPAAMEFCIGNDSPESALAPDWNMPELAVDIHIGNSDPNYPYASSDHLRFVAQGWIDQQTIFYSEFVGGHTYTTAQLGEIWSNLCPHAVTQ